MTSNTAVNPNATLSSTAFLQLMMTQLQYQNPLNSSNSSQFMNELTQMSSMEQLTNLVSETQTVASELGLSLGAQLLGKTVTLQDTSGTTVKGTVSAVNMNAGSPEVMVGGKAYAASSVTQVTG